MRVIVTSQRDIAGTNIYSILSQNYGFKKTGEFEGRPAFEREGVLLIATEKSQVEAEHLDDHFSPEYYVVASRHRSASGERTLTVHVPGNLTSEAKVGGRPRELGFAEPDAMKAALQSLEKTRRDVGLDYKVSMEVTHHGPTSLRRPVLFVEVGSTEAEWNDPEAVDAVAKSALAAAENRVVYETGVGIGGNHYAPRHTQFVLESKYALGHLVPAYALDSFDAEMFRLAVEKSGATFCFLDWKGMNKGQRKEVMELAESLGISVRKSISSGGVDVPGGYRIFSVNAEIFSMAEKTDRVRLREAISNHGGVPIEKNGHLIQEFMAPADIRGEVLKACLNILKGKNPVFSGRRLIFEEEKFDPEKAVNLGVQPGPDFAKLKSGLTLRDGDRTVFPGDVVRTNKIQVELDEETFELLKSFI